MPVIRAHPIHFTPPFAHLRIAYNVSQDQQKNQQSQQPQPQPQLSFGQVSISRINGLVQEKLKELQQDVPNLVGTSVNLTASPHQSTATAQPDNNKSDKFKFSFYQIWSHDVANVFADLYNQQMPVGNHVQTGAAVTQFPDLPSLKMLRPKIRTWQATHALHYEDDYFGCIITDELTSLPTSPTVADCGYVLQYCELICLLALLRRKLDKPGGYSLELEANTLQATVLCIDSALHARVVTASVNPKIQSLPPNTNISVPIHFTIGRTIDLSSIRTAANSTAEWKEVAGSLINTLLQTSGIIVDNEPQARNTSPGHPASRAVRGQGAADTEGKRIPSDSSTSTTQSKVELSSPTSTSTKASSVDSDDMLHQSWVQHSLEEEQEQEQDGAMCD